VAARKTKKSRSFELDIDHFNSYLYKKGAWLEFQEDANAVSFLVIFLGVKRSGATSDFI
jgi:hypothetical protein